MSDIATVPKEALQEAWVAALESVMDFFDYYEYGINTQAAFENWYKGKLNV